MPPHDARSMEDYLRKTYFREGFSQYTIRFFELNNEDIMLNYSDEENGASFVSVPTMQRSMNTLTKNELYYTFSPSGEITYLAAYPIMKRDSLVGKLYAELKVNSYKQSEVYPELLLEEKDKLPPTIFRYSYGIYNGTHLVDQSGSYSYDYHLPWTSDPNVKTQFISESNYQHLIYHATPDLLVVVTNRNDLFLNLFSYFSFLFVIMFLLVLGMLLMLGRDPKPVVVEIFTNVQDGFHAQPYSYGSDGIHYCIHHSHWVFFGTNYSSPVSRAGEKWCGRKHESPE